MQRFIVTRQYIKYKGVLYKKGELLPPDFTERDRCRNIYPSRIGTTEVPESKAEEQPKATPTSIPNVTPKVTPVKALSSAGSTFAAKPLSSPLSNTGTKPVPVMRDINSK